MTSRSEQSRIRAGARVVVVGPCASGKSTLVDGLRERGIDARVSGQEHSAVPELWRRMAPDMLVALDIDLDTIRKRRTPTWPEAVYLVQRDRLRSAFAAADLVIDTTTVDAEAVLEQVLDAIGGEVETGSARDQDVEGTARS